MNLFPCRAKRRRARYTFIMPYLATIASFGFGDFQPFSLLNLYRKLGCVACQYYRNEQQPADVAEALRVVGDLGLRFDSIHGVFGPAHDPSSPDESVRRTAMDTYRREGELALRLGGPKVVVHPAPMAPHGHDITLAERQARQTPLERSLDELTRMGEALGVTYLMENLPGNYWTGHIPAALAQRVRHRNSPRLRLCFDTGHAHMTTDMIAALEQCMDVVDYLHVHDNNGRFDSHLFPGHGTIAWDRLTPVLRRWDECMAKTPLIPRHPSETQLPGALPGAGAMLELFYTEYPIHLEIDDGLAGRLAQWLALATA
ncbi:MAG: sugar phosphate isomerase/epimerase [Phycisphaeraceae bacterium]|nr:sugar phosphate isomerase/epimerase [Phycisphaeraceae bacterium]